MKVALIQLSAGADKAANIAKAMGMTEQALAKGARFVLLPEAFNFRGDTRRQEAIASIAEKIPGPSLTPFARLAQQSKAYILLGSIFEKAPKGKAYNTSVLLNPDGQITARYRKIHLFDARLGDKIIREAACFNAGKALAVARVDHFKVGLSICYDVRFPALYGRYTRRGAQALAVPSAFTRTTGQAHWEILLRARAVENLAYVLAPNQVGCDFCGVASYGNSMIVAPWGEIIARGSNDREEIVFGEMDIREVAKARAVLPGIVK